MIRLGYILGTGEFVAMAWLLTGLFAAVLPLRPGILLQFSPLTGYFVAILPGDEGNNT